MKGQPRQPRKPYAIYRRSLERRSDWVSYWSGYLTETLAIARFQSACYAFGRKNVILYVGDSAAMRQVFSNMKYVKLGERDETQDES